MSRAAAFLLRAALMTACLLPRTSLLAAEAPPPEAYRERLTVDAARQRWVYLKVPRELLAERLNARRGHYMRAVLLDSQLAALEVPEDALVVEATAAPDALVATLLRELGPRPAP
ncbi:hypothetical protein [Archangium violaceum]|uniref:hypothetical protein n=1 Tax=Archangium violaceum TaxID=83451 RepID=UPI001269D5DF|nr:hypothetical protein [Archangium violaceum]